MINAQHTAQQLESLLAPHTADLQKEIEIDQSIENLSTHMNQLLSSGALASYIKQLKSKDYRAQRDLAKSVYLAVAKHFNIIDESESAFFESILNNYILMKSMLREDRDFLGGNFSMVGQDFIEFAVLSKIAKIYTKNKTLNCQEYVNFITKLESSCNKNVFIDYAIDDSEHQDSNNVNIDKELKALKVSMLLSPAVNVIVNWNSFYFSNYSKKEVISPVSLITEHTFTQNTTTHPDSTFSLLSSKNEYYRDNLHLKALYKQHPNIFTVEINNQREDFYKCSSTSLDLGYSNADLYLTMGGVADIAKKDLQSLKYLSDQVEQTKVIQFCLQDIDQKMAKFLQKNASFVRSMMEQNSASDEKQKNNTKKTKPSKSTQTLEYSYEEYDNYENTLDSGVNKAKRKIKSFDSLPFIKKIINSITAIFSSSKSTAASSPYATYKNTENANNEYLKVDKIISQLPVFSALGPKVTELVELVKKVELLNKDDEFLKLEINAVKKSIVEICSICIKTKPITEEQKTKAYEMLDTSISNTLEKLKEIEGSYQLQEQKQNLKELDIASRVMQMRAENTANRNTMSAKR